MIDEQLAKRIESMEVAISGLSRRIAILEGDPEETEAEAATRERAAYEQRMSESGIPQVFWKAAK